MREFLYGENGLNPVSQEAQFKPSNIENEGGKTKNTPNTQKRHAFSLKTFFCILSSGEFPNGFAMPPPPAPRSKPPSIGALDWKDLGPPKLLFDCCWLPKERCPWPSIFVAKLEEEEEDEV